MPKSGPAPVSMYSPKAAESIQALNQYLRKTVVGSRFFELSALIAAGMPYRLSLVVASLAGIGSGMALALMNERHR